MKKYKNTNNKHDTQNTQMRERVSTTLRMIHLFDFYDIKNAFL